MKPVRGLWLVAGMLWALTGMGGTHAAHDDEPETPAAKAEPVTLPKLLTKDFFSLDHICKDAKAKGRELALVAVKSHICDCEASVQFCMHISRNYSDTCNAFLQKNFSIYHTRSHRYPEFTEGECEALPWGEFVSKEWEKIAKDIGPGPGVYVIDVGTCKPVAKISSGLASRDKDAEKRRAKTKKDVIDALKTIKEPSAAVKKALADTSLTCPDKGLVEKSNPTLKEIWQALEAQSQEHLPKPLLKEMPKK